MLQALHYLALIVASGLGITSIGLCLRPTRTKAGMDEVVAFSALWGVLFISVAALVLADLGSFSICALDVLALVLGLTGWMLVRRNGLPIDTRPERREGRGSLVVLLLLAAFLYARPFEYVKGGWDPGIYSSIAAHIARDGALTAADPLLDEVPEADRTPFLYYRTKRIQLYPGFLVENGCRPLRPSYYHLYPAWTAVSFSLFGVKGLFHANYLPALAALLIFYCYARRAFSPATALLACAFLVASPAQIYFARFQASEMLSQLFLLGACWSLAWAVQRRDEPLLFGEVTSAACLAAAFLINSIAALPILFVAGTWGLFALRENRPVFFRFLAILGIVTIAAFLRNWTQAHLVTVWLTSRFMKRGRTFAMFFMIMVIIVMAGVVLLLKRRSGRPPVAGGKWLEWSGIALPVLILVLAGYGYFVRPRIATGTEANNLLLLGWLVSPMAVAMAVLFFFLHRPHRWDLQQVLFIVPAGITGLVFLSNKMIRPLLIYAARRYVLLLVPLTVLLAAVAVTWLFGKIRHRSVQGALVLVSASILGYEAWQSLPIVRVREYRGSPAFYAQAAELAREADLLFCDHHNDATPLRFIFGIPAYQFSRQAQEGAVGICSLRTEWMKRWVAQGREIYYMSESGPFFDPDIHLWEKGRVAYTTERLHRRRDRLPRSIVEERNEAGIYRLARSDVEPPQYEAEYMVDVGYQAFGLIRGFHRERKSRHRTYRWTNGRAEMYVPCYGSMSDTELTLELAAKRPDELGPVVSVEILIDDRFVDTLAVAKDWEEYTIVIPARFWPASTPHRVAKLSIHSDTWDPAKHDIEGYPQDLGIRVASVGVRAVEASRKERPERRRFFLFGRAR